MKRKASITIALIGVLVLSSCTPKVEKESESSEVSNAEEIMTGGYVLSEVNKDDYIGKIEKSKVESRNVIPALPDYEIATDLSNVENLDYIQNVMADWQMEKFSESQKSALVKNGFFVRNGEEYITQMYNIYETNQYANIPSFITTDSVYHLYHIVFSAMLRDIESEYLLGEVSELNGRLLKDQIAMKEKLSDDYLIERVNDNIAFLTVGELILGKEVDSKVDSEQLELAKAELKEIEAAEELTNSKIYENSRVDYSLFKPRGHYTYSEDLTKYFKMMSLYGNVPMQLYDFDNNRLVDETSSAILLSIDIANDEEALAKWGNIYEITSTFVGESDDLNFIDYVNVLHSILGRNVNLEKIADEEFINSFYEAVDALEGPAIGMSDIKNFRLMGQRYVLDSEIYSNLIAVPDRLLPRSMDFMASMGSERATELSLSDEYNSNYSMYPENLVKSTKFVEGLSEDFFDANMYNGWIKAIESSLKTYGSGYPKFMQSDAWTDKNLNTALGSYTELKHDTVLYAKQPMAEMGGYEKENVPAYVEPNVEAYERIKGLLLDAKSYMDSTKFEYSFAESVDEFIEMLDFLIDCSYRELEGKELSSDDYEQLSYIGGIMERITIRVSMNRNDDRLADVPLDVALISDIATALQGDGNMSYLSVAIGNPSEIYVLVPIGDKIYLTRGAVYDFYEFESDKRYNDDEWRDEYKSGGAPERPAWTESFIVNK